MALGLIVLASGAVTVTAPAEGKASGCRDGRDNDRDGLTDAADPGCKNARDRSEIFKKGAACDNGRDDDGDGTVDVGGGKKKRKKGRAAPDTGCTDPRDTDETAAEEPEPETACSDGRDNEPDGLTDADDPGCRDPSDTTETDPNGPECDNGRDDDEDTDEDFRVNDTGDAGCSSVSDDNEGSGGGGGDGDEPPADDPPADDPPADDPPADDPPADDPPADDPPPANGTLACAPASINFGDTEAAPNQQVKNQQVTCTATGGSVAISSFTRTSGSTDFVRVAGGTCVGRTLSAGGSCVETVRYRAEEFGPVSAVFTVAHNGTNGARTINVSGNGILVQG
jgi:hypothetical protein